MRTAPSTSRCWRGRGRGPRPGSRGPRSTGRSRSSNGDLTAWRRRALLSSTTWLSWGSIGTSCWKRSSGTPPRADRPMKRSMKKQAEKKNADLPPLRTTPYGGRWARELVCSKTGMTAPLDKPAFLSPAGAPWLVEYDLDEAKGDGLLRVLAGRPWTLWRYRELLPLLDFDNRVDLGEGGTPLVRFRRLLPETAKVE